MTTNFIRNNHFIFFSGGSAIFPKDMINTCPGEFFFLPYHTLKKEVQGLAALLWSLHQAVVRELI